MEISLVPCRSYYVTSGPSEAHACPRRPRDRAAESGHEDRILPVGVGREEGDDLAIVEREAGRAETLGVGAQIEPAADETGLEIGDAIAAIAQPIERTAQVGEKEDRDRRRASERLLETEERGIAPEIA